MWDDLEKKVAEQQRPVLHLSCKDKNNRRSSWSAMNTITQVTTYRQAVIKYAEKKGVTAAARCPLCDHYVYYSTSYVCFQKLSAIRRGVSKQGYYKKSKSPCVCWRQNRTDTDFRPHLAGLRTALERRPVRENVRQARSYGFFYSYLRMIFRDCS